MGNHYHLLIGAAKVSFPKECGSSMIGTPKYLIEKECYLLELSRYIVLNPVRARMVNSAKACQLNDVTGGLIAN